MAETGGATEARHSLRESLDEAAASVAAFPPFMRSKPLAQFELKTLKRAREMVAEQLAELDAAIQEKEAATS